MTKPVIAIVGAGPGLGLAVARRFGQAGYAAALIARRQGALDLMVAELNGEGILAQGFVADIIDEAALKRALQEARSSLGPISVVQFSPVPAPEGDGSEYTPTGLDRATMDRLHKLVILGAITTVREVLPAMQSSGGGSIFLTTSGSAHHVMPVYTPVGMTMAGLRSYGLCLHEVLQAAGVYVATVCIGVLIRKGDPVGDPAVLADHYFRLHKERAVAEEMIFDSADLNALHDRDMAERGLEWRRPETAE